MDPTTLIAPSSPMGYPAPYWFLVVFKVLGLTLHMVPMNIWYAGIPVAMLLYWQGGEQGKLASGRLMTTMPILVALGINFGIVPLLFLQVAYPRVFYPATILMAWPWFSIIALLVVAYYGVYMYASGLKNQGKTLTPVRRASGWVAAVVFVLIGFLFTNAFSLMSAVERWPDLWQRSQVGGAPLGTILNTGDPSLWPRWLMMFGLALTTTAAYLVVDAAFFARGESEQYRQSAQRIALSVSTAGIAWFALSGIWYVFGSWPEDVRAKMFGSPMIVLTVLTAVGPGIPWLLIAMQRQGVKRGLALATGVTQFMALGLNAISRQMVQNAKLSHFLDVTAQPVQVQWSPLLLFLFTFAAGIGVVAWMLIRAAGSRPQTAVMGG